MDVEIPAEFAAQHDLASTQLGRLAEQDLDRAVLVGSRGRVQPYLQVADVHGVDRAYAWNGVGPPWFVQAKASGRALPDRSRHWKIRGAHFTPDDQLQLIACILGPASGFGTRSPSKRPSCGRALRRL